ncbi:type II secretion system F family protein [Nocardioides immobilis]|uniref:type II secretion system F family protein n=1 Tax=Nocardioides immobilis TaxID=2049295 RepID=UPI001C716E60|nr:hypothetical protein [Nocardioides immobilis]
MVAVLGVLLAVGLIGLVRLARGLPLLPVDLTRFTRRRAAMSKREQRTMVLAAVVGVGVLAVSRNAVFAVIAAAGAVLWPLVTGGGKAERAALAKLEALAAWTESLRDLAQKGAGLESVIPRTVDTAADVLAPPLRHLSFRLSVRVPLPEALSLFADEVNDSSADLVVAALALAARQRKGQLSRVLTALSTSLRDELEQRTKVMRERNTVRWEAGQVAVLTAALVVAASLFSPQGLPEASSGAAEVLPLLLATAYVFVFSRVRKLAEPEPEPRFLSSASEVLEAASYRPKGVNL